MASARPFTSIFLSSFSPSSTQLLFLKQVHRPLWDKATTAAKSPDRRAASITKNQAISGQFGLFSFADVCKIDVSQIAPDSNHPSPENIYPNLPIIQSFKLACPYSLSSLDADAMGFFVRAP